MRLRYLLLMAAGLAGPVAESGAAAVASGRNWQLAVDGIACEGSLVTISTQIRYLGPGGIVEAPLSQLADGDGKPVPPRSLVWKSGSKQLAAWLSAGGLTTLQPGASAEIQLRFTLPEAAQGLKLEFGDIRAFSLTRAGSKDGFCASLLKPAQIPVPRKARPARVEDTKRALKVYRAAYPCLPAPRAPWRTTEAQYPPYAPEQLLVFGRGYLPNLRLVQLPMGRAAAQSYAYAGADELDAVENAARRAQLADFPEYSGAKHYAFNWGTQKAASGNDIYSIGIYAVQPCRQ